MSECWCDIIKTKNGSQKKKSCAEGKDAQTNGATLERRGQSSADCDSFSDCETQGDHSRWYCGKFGLQCENDLVPSLAFGSIWAHIESLSRADSRTRTFSLRKDPP